MEHPSANIWLDEETEELAKTDLLIRFGSHTVKVRQVAVYVYITQSHVKDAAVHVAVRGGREIPRAIRLHRAGHVSWGGMFEPITGEADPFFDEKGEKAVASAVHKILSAKQAQTLLAGLGQWATMFFTIEGHSNAYLTTKDLYELPMGKAYRVVTRLVGEGLTFPPTQGIYVELNDWNDIYVNYDIDYIRLYRKLVRWARKHIGSKPWGSYFRSFSILNRRLSKPKSCSQPSMIVLSPNRLILNRTAVYPFIRSPFK